jgi:myo-inositol-1(or 4)-monophosphatase
MLQAVIDAVRKAAHAEVMPRFRSARGSVKPDGTLLTEADTAAQQSLARSLRAVRDAPVLGEEMSAADQAEAWSRGADGLWCVDPVDGTTNFVHGLPYFAVSAAFLVQGRPRLGVVYNPALDELFAAESGHGAACNGVPLAASAPKADLAATLAAFDPKYLPRRLASTLALDPPYYSVRNWGAGALDWCYLAAGRFDVYVHGGQKLWDYAAGALIHAEAGGAFATFTDDDFWRPAPWSRSIIAANGDALFRQWCAWIRLAGGFRPELIET